MKKIKCGKNIELMSYDADNLNDIALSIFNWMDGLDKDEVRDVVYDLKNHKCLNEKGLALLEEMDKILEEEFQKDRLLYKEEKPCRKCGEKIYRKNYSELMLNPQMELIDLCPKHFGEDYGKRTG